MFFFVHLIPELNDVSRCDIFVSSNTHCVCLFVSLTLPISVSLTRKDPSTGIDWLRICVTIGNCWRSIRVSFAYSPSIYRYIFHIYLTFCVYLFFSTLSVLLRRDFVIITLPNVRCVILYVFNFDSIMIANRLFFVHF